MYIQSAINESSSYHFIHQTTDNLICVMLTRGSNSLIFNLITLHFKGKSIKKPIDDIL